jgi:Prenyltransferase and squalene oxidase repeat
MRSISWLSTVALVICASSPAAEPEPNLRPPSPLPVPAETLAASVRRGVEYLVTTQNKDGSWGGPRWTGGVDVDPVPGAHYGFTAAVTAMCVEALLEVGGDAPAVKAAIDRGTDYLLRELPKLRRADPGNLPNVWGHSLGIQTLAALHERTTDPDRRAEYEKQIREQLALLTRFETVHGGWFYYANGLQRPLAPSCSFVNASVLVSLDRARRIGIELPAKVVERAVQSTAEQRTPETSFIYSMGSPLTAKASAAAPINRPAGSLGRTQACNVALRLYGDKRITDDVIKAWLDRLVTRQGWLDMGRKRPIPHESFAQVAGYFYYFGHYHAALAIGLLPPADRPFYQDHLAKILIERQEPDGSWFDYPLYSYHKPYGTAFALLSLGCCRAR